MLTGKPFGAAQGLREEESSEQQWSKSDMRTSRVKLESNCFLLEALVFSFGGLHGFFLVASGVIRDPGDDTGTHVRSFILKLENSMVQKSCDCREEEQFNSESLLEA